MLLVTIIYQTTPPPKKIHHDTQASKNPIHHATDHIPLFPQTSIRTIAVAKL